MQPSRMPPVYRPTFPSNRGISRRPTMPPGGALPLPPLPPPLWSPQQAPMAGPPSADNEIPAVQDQTQPSTAPGAPGQPSPGFMAKLKDPRFANWLMTVGAAMGQPRAVGQTGWGQAAQALNQGYSGIAAYNEMQRQQELQNRQLQTQEQLAAASMAKTKSDIGLGGRAADQGDKKIAQDERLTMAQIHAQDARIDKELEARGKMDETARAANKEQWQATLQLNRDKLKQDATNDEARLKAAEADRMLKKIELDDRKVYQQGSLAVDRANAGSNSVRSAAQADLDRAQAKSIGEGTGRNGVSGTGTTPDERRQLRNQNLLLRIMSNALPGESDEDLNRKYNSAKAILDREEGTGGGSGGPDPNLPDGTRVRGPDGKTYVMKGGQPVPEESAPTPAPAKVDPVQAAKEAVANGESVDFGALADQQNAQRAAELARQFPGSTPPPLRIKPIRSPRSIKIFPNE